MVFQKVISLASILFIAAAAIFKSIADTLQHHFDTSVFKNKNPKWWNPMKSWAYVKFLPLTKYRPDAWHLANSAMIISFIAAVVAYKPQLPWYAEMAIGGLCFNLIFEFFYAKVLRRGN